MLNKHAKTLKQANIALAIMATPGLTACGQSVLTFDDGTLQSVAGA